ncbi:MAG: phytanoyl-CoA dioxygenase family protein [Planctomycetota bacterium]
MALTKAQIERYQQDGFLLVDGLFDRTELAGMKAEIKRVLQQAGKSGMLEGGTGVYVGLTAASRMFHDINADRRVVEPLTQLMGPDVEFWSDKVVFKSAKVDFASPWHQDWWYWEGANKVSIWIALDDATPENGCLKFLPGSHRSVLRKAAGVNDDKFVNRMEDGAVDEAKAVTVPVAAGGGVFFHDLALHSSLPNVKKQDRWALISTYRDAAQADKLTDFATGAFMVAGERKALERNPQAVYADLTSAAVG